MKKITKPQPPPKRAVLTKPKRQRVEAGTKKSSRQIAERNKAEALRESEEKYRSIFERALEGIFQSMPEGHFIAVNPAMAHIYGYASPQEMIASVTDISRQIYADSQTRSEFVDLLNSKGFIEKFEARNLRKDGSLFWTKTNARAVKDADGKVIYYEGFVTDITERKRAEEQLAERQKFLEIITNATPDIIYLYDPRQQRHRYINRELEGLLGYSNEEIKKAGADLLLKSVHMDDLPRMMEHMQTLASARDDSLHELEYRIKGKGGGYLWFFVREKVYLRNDAGQPELLFGIVQDITERKRVELELQESEKQFSTVFFTNPVSQSILSQITGLVIEVNDACCNLYGYSRAEMLGADPGQLDLWANPADQLPILDELQRTGHVLSTEVMIRKKSGEIHTVLFTVEPISWKGIPCLLTSSMDITERKRAEEELRLSNERFVNAFRFSPAGMTITRIANGKFVDANDSFCRMLEFSREEVVGHTSNELNMWTPEERKKLIDEQIRSGGLQNFELQARSKSGRVVNILFSSKPMELGGETHHITTMIDITERKRAEERIAYQADLLANVNDAVLASDENFVLIAWNKAAERIYGWTAEEVIGKSGTEILQTEFLTISRPEAIKQLIESGEYFAEVLNSRKDGVKIYIETRMTALRDPIGKTVGYVSINRDITERKLAEEALRGSEEKFRLLTDHSIQGISLSYADGMAYVNPAYCAITGYSREEMLNFTLTQQLEMIHPEDRAFAIERRARLSKGEVLEENDEIRLIHKDGETRWIIGSTKSFILQGKPVFLGMTIDNTDRKHAEEKLRESEERLRLSTELANVAVWEYSFNTNSMLRSRNHDRLYGLEWQTRWNIDTFLNATHPEDREFSNGMIQKSVAAGGPDQYQFDFRAVYPDMSIHWLMVIGQVAERNPEGQGTLVRGCLIDITERKQAEDEVNLSRDRLADLSRKLVETQERESRVIGRELHDQIGQILTALKLTMEIAPQLPPESAQKKYAQAQELVDDLLTRVSNLSLELRPPMLDDLGLVPALLWHVNRYQEQSGIAVDFKHSRVKGKRFDPQIETTVYRIAQEALTNVARHAHATRVRLEVRATDGELTVEIEDNGRGFNPQEALAEKRSSGLRGIRERASLLGGTFRIESQPGKGTKKFIRLPLLEKTS